MGDFDRLRSVGVIPILRLPDSELALAAGEALAEAGMRAVEVTAGVPRGASVLAALAAHLKGEDVLLGAGTILTVEQAEEFVSAGAEFIVSPVFDSAVSAACKALKVAYVPAGFTPAELERAVLDGAPLVKLFPAGPVGPPYVRAILGPFPDMPLLPTGGIDFEMAVEFIRAGALAVGMGGKLCPRTLEDVGPAAKAASELLKRVDEARSSL